MAGHRVRLAACLLIAIGFAGVAEAQAQSGCGSPLPPSLGVAIGYSSPYLDLASGVVEGPGSVLVHGGVQFAGRADLSVGGPLRLRIEAGTARWDVRQRTYDAMGSVTADTSAGRMSARHLVGLVGLRTGRAPLCAHVSAGGGVYGIAFRDQAVWRPGAALAAGVEFATGDHGAVQVDAVLHLIGTRDAYPIASSTVPVLNLLVGWAYRF